MSFPLLSSILLCPIIALCIVLSLPSSMSRMIKWVSLISSLATLLLSIHLMRLVDFKDSSFQLIESIPWIPEIGITYSMGVDGISAVMVLLTAIVIVCGVLCSWGITYRVKSFFANLLFLVSGVYGVFMTTDLFFFFLFYEVAVLPMYLLIAVWGSTNKEYAAMKLTLYLLLGSAFILVGFLFLYCMPNSGTFNLIEIKEQVVFSPALQYILYPIFFVGFAVLAACFPFHVWSPDGHVAAPTAASMLHAGVLMKLGTYGIIRIAVYLFPEGAKDWALITAVLACCNIIYGALIATQQKDLKYMIGFSSVSHMGIVLLGISSLTYLGLQGAVFQMFSHGIMTALFFACVGFIYDQSHTRNTDELGGLSKKAPVISALFIIAGLVGLGLPGFSGFVAEILVIIGATQAFPILGILSITSLLITAYYVLSAIQKTFYGKISEKASLVEDVTFMQSVPRITLVGVLLFFGLFPLIFLNWTSESILNLIRQL